MTDKFHDELVLTVRSAVGILSNVEARLPSEVLWRFLAEDLLRRIDEAVPQRDVAPSLEIPSSPKAVSERDAGGRLDWFS